MANLAKSNGQFGQKQWWKAMANSGKKQWQIWPRAMANSGKSSDKRQWQIRVKAMQWQIRVKAMANSGKSNRRKLGKRRHNYITGKNYCFCPNFPLLPPLIFHCFCSNFPLLLPEFFVFQNFRGAQCPPPPASYAYDPYGGAHPQKKIIFQSGKRRKSWY